VRTNWRKRRRKLFEQAPASEVERIDATPEALPAAIERFVAIERQSWKGEAGIGVGADARHLAFYRDWFGRLGPQQASFHFLRRDGQDLAGLIVLRQGRTAYSRHITYAPAQASLSPAVILRAEVVRSLCQSGLDELDLLGMRPSAGEQRHKTDWSTHQRATTAHVLLRRRGLMLPVVLIKRVKQALRQRRDTLALD
jgi:CelD/BcsL family acetyltransferase involved in cellulose biosynthesis